jgi:hypothetical protein
VNRGNEEGSSVKISKTGPGSAGLRCGAWWGKATLQPFDPAPQERQFPSLFFNSEYFDFKCFALSDLSRNVNDPKEILQYDLPYPEGPSSSQTTPGMV